MIALLEDAIDYEADTPSSSSVAAAAAVAQAQISARSITPPRPKNGAVGFMAKHEKHHDKDHSRDRETEHKKKKKT